MPATTRRGFLTRAATAVGAAALAGCQSRPASLTPQLPSARLKEGGWHQIDEIRDRAREEVAVAGTTQQVAVEAVARVFENQAPLTPLADRFDFDPSQYPLPPETFVAAKARIEPPQLGWLARSNTVLDRVIDAAEGRAIQQLRANGFERIERVDEGALDIQAGPTATHRRYRADYPYESFEVPVDGRRVNIVAGAVSIEAQLALWEHRGLLVTGAGVYPGEPGRLVATVDGVSRELSLQFQPEQYRSDVQRLIALVS